MSKHDDVPDVGDGDDEQFDTFKINMQGVNETAKAPRRSLRKMFSMRGSMLSRELQDGDFKFTRRTSQILTELDKLDKDGDGEINAVDIASYVDKKMQQKTKLKYWRWAAFVSFVMLVVALGVNMGLTYAVVEMSKETKFKQGVMTVKDSGELVATKDVVNNDELDENNWNAFLEQVTPDYLADVKHIQYVNDEGVKHGFQVTGFDLDDSRKNSTGLSTVTLYGNGNETYKFEPYVPVPEEEEGEVDHEGRHLLWHGGPRHFGLLRSNWFQKAKLTTKNRSGPLKVSKLQSAGNANKYTVKFEADTLIYQKDYLVGSKYPSSSREASTFQEIKASRDAFLDNSYCNRLPYVNKHRKWLVRFYMKQCGGLPRLALAALNLKMRKAKQAMYSYGEQIIDCGTQKTLNELCFFKQKFTMSFNPQSAALSTHFDKHMMAVQGRRVADVKLVNMQNAMLNYVERGHEEFAYASHLALAKGDDKIYETYFLDRKPIGLNSTEEENRPYANYGLMMFALFMRSRRVAMALKAAILGNEFRAGFRYGILSAMRQKLRFFSIGSTFNQGDDGDTYFSTYPHQDNYDDVYAMFGVENGRELLDKFCEDSKPCWIGNRMTVSYDEIENTPTEGYEPDDLQVPLFPTTGNNQRHRRTLWYHADGYLMTLAQYTLSTNEHERHECDVWDPKFCNERNAGVRYHFMVMNDFKLNRGCYASNNALSPSQYNLEQEKNQDGYKACIEKRKVSTDENELLHIVALPKFCWNDYDDDKLGLFGQLPMYGSTGGRCRVKCEYGTSRVKMYSKTNKPSNSHLGYPICEGSKISGSGDGTYCYIPEVKYCRIIGLDTLAKQRRGTDAGESKIYQDAFDKLWGAYTTYWSRDEEAWTFSIAKQKGRPVLNFDMVPADLRLITEVNRLLVRPKLLGTQEGLDLSKYRIWGVVSARKDHGGGVWQSSVWQSSVWESGSQTSELSDSVNSTDGTSGDTISSTSTVWQSSVWGQIWQSSVWDASGSTMSVWQSSVWQSSIWQSQMWHTGQSSVWTSGQSSIWQSAVWSTSTVWQSSIWQSSVWQSAVWQSSVWQSSVWGQSSVWQSAVWGQSSVWGQSAVWGDNSPWKKAVSCSDCGSSVWQSSVWQSSIWQSSIWQSSIWGELSSATHSNLNSDFETGADAFKTFKSTSGTKYNPTTDDDREALTTLMQNGNCQVWQASIWQSSVWQSSVWEKTGYESRAMRVMQSAIWQSSVWEEYFWVGQVWRLTALTFKDDDESKVQSASWKAFTVKNGEQQCPPLHLKQVQDPSYQYDGTLPSQTCKPDKISLPSNLGEDVHVFIFDTGVDIFHPDLMDSVYDSSLDASWSNVEECQGDTNDCFVISNNGHLNAVDVEEDCDVDVDCILKFGSYDLNTNDLDAAQYCASPLVDCHGHGTHTASLAVGTVSGVAKKAILHSVRVANCKGVAETAAIVKGLQFVEKVVKQQKWKAVVSLSLGGDKDSTMESALTSLLSKGIPAVCAAGNTAQDSSLFSPAGLSTCITVGAADPEGYAATFSNFGKAVDVFAPGVEVVTAAAVAEVCRDGMYSGSSKPTLSRSTYPGDDIYTTATGTSFACPIVTGIVASKLSALTYTASSSSIDFDGTTCTYNPSDDADVSNTDEPCSEKMHSHITNAASTNTNLASRTSEATATFTKSGDTGTVSVGTSSRASVLGGTTKKFAKWDPSSTARRSLLSSDNTDDVVMDDESTSQILQSNESESLEVETSRRKLQGSGSLFVQNDMRFSPGGEHYIKTLGFWVSKERRKIEIIVRQNGGIAECSKIPLSLMLHRGTALYIESDNLVYAGGKYQYELNVALRKSFREGKFHLRLYRHMSKWKRERLHWRGNAKWNQAHRCRYRAIIKLTSL